MRTVFYVLSVVAVMVLAVWAYRENHRTQQAMAEAAQLQRDIRSLRQALNVQRAEWAFLTRPERLSELAELNFARLQLLPMTGQQFGRIDEIAYPAPEATALDGVVELLGEFAPEAESGQ